MAENTAFHYHPDGWMNDGKMFFVNGEYHVFFQYKWPRHWGHVMSRDLLNWEELPIALYPGENADPDGEGGCFTGCCIEVDGRFHIFYTGSGSNGVQTTCHAVSDDMISWKKDENNPILLPNLPYNTKPGAAWRDPCVWQADGIWYMAQCAESARSSESQKSDWSSESQKSEQSVDYTVFGNRCIALMKSEDLVNWEMCPPLYSSNSMCMYECPDVFKLDEHWVTLFSCQRTYAAVSENMLEGYHLNRPVSYLDNDLYYAAKTLLDDKGRRLLWGFIFENSGWASDVPNRDELWKDAFAGRSWSNVLAMPRELFFDEAGALCCRLPAEIYQLREKRIPLSLETVFGKWEACAKSDTVACNECSNDMAIAFVENASTDCVEVHCTVELDECLATQGWGKAGVVLRAGDDLDDIATVAYDVATNSVSIEDSRASMEAAHSRVWENFVSAPFMPVSMPACGGTGCVELDIFLDSTVTEVFIDQKRALSGRTYPKSSESLRIGFFTNTKGACFKKVEIWQLDSEKKY